MPAGHAVVVAGVNGAGKSSVIEAAVQALGSRYFNPDTEARAVLRENPGVSPQVASALALRRVAEMLRRLRSEDLRFTFETTLGGSIMTRRLIEIAEAGGTVEVFFIGLEGIDLHLRRVADRVQGGGHDIPEARIRERYVRSRQNLIRLLPHISRLDLYDNTERPRLLLRYPDGTASLRVGLHEVPMWAKPIVVAALDQVSGG